MEQGTIEFFDAETKSWTTVADDGLKRRFFKDDNVDAILFKKGDRVSFTPESTSGGTKHYARKVKLIGVPDKPMNAKKAEIAEEIMKANDYLAMTQAFAPGYEDKKGYSVTTFWNGVCLQQMWDDDNEAMPNRMKNPEVKARTSDVIQRSEQRRRLDCSPGSCSGSSDDTQERLIAPSPRRVVCTRRGLERSNLCGNAIEEPGWHF